MAVVTNARSHVVTVGANHAQNASLEMMAKSVMGGTHAIFLQLLKLQLNALLIRRMEELLCQEKKHIHAHAAIQLNLMFLVQLGNALMIYHLWMIN